MLPPRRTFQLWALLTLAGAAVIALPDDNDRLVTFTPGHGLAPLDLAGTVLVGGGLALYVMGLVVGRHALERRDVLVALAVYLPGSVLTGWSVSTDTGWWWLLGVVVALGAQAGLAWRVSARTDAAPGAG